jgi:hypothetical protein
MNVDEKTCSELYAPTLNRFEWFVELVFSKPEKIFAYDTCQFANYDKYVCECFDKVHKQKRKEEQFPIELEKAFNLGKSFV